MVSNRDPAGTRLPIKLDATTKGEFAPIPLDLTLQESRQRALTLAGERARRLGVTRRWFLVSACGAIGLIARRYPDVNFLIYHSGWVPMRQKVLTTPGARTLSTPW